MRVTDLLAKFHLLATLLIGLALAACATSLQLPSAGTLKGDEPADMLNAKLKVPSGSGPFPAVVLMHGCGGWHGGNISDWANWFVDRDWIALALDSFGTRGITEICTSPRVSTTQRALDAYGAFDYLAAQPNVDARRIIVMGFSHGGGTVVRTMSGNILRDYRQPGAKRFRAGIALYPGHCTIAKPYGPVSIIIGALDDWTWASECLRGLEFNGFPNEIVSFHVLEDAYHSFDMFTRKGRAVGPRRFLGHYLEPNRAATEQARNIVAEFLQRLPALAVD